MKNNIKVIVSVMVLILFFALWYNLSYYQLPRGDDVVFQFSKGITYYLDDVNIELGDKILTLKQDVNTVKMVYNNWSGRVIGYFLIPFLTILGQKPIAIITSLIFISIILMASLLIFDESKKILEKPIILFFLGVGLFYLPSYMNFMLMWTFVTIYGISTLMILIMIKLTSKIYVNSSKSKLKKLIFINFIGFFTGFTHEIYIAVYIAVVISDVLIEYLKDKKSILKIKYYIGLFIGFFISFTAPGNFVRMNSTHDSGINAKLIYKINNSIYMHIDIIKENKVLFIILLLFYTFVYMSFKNKSLGNFRLLFDENRNYIFGILFSIIGWSFSSYVPRYGLLLYLCFLIIISFRLLNRCSINSRFVSFLKKAEIIIILILSILLIFLNYKWIFDMKEITEKRRELIIKAKNNNESSVKVPRYKDSLNKKFTMPDYDNGQEQFDTEYYKKYYGVHVSIE